MKRRYFLATISAAVAGRPLLAQGVKQAAAGAGDSFLSMSAFLTGIPQDTLNRQKQNSGIDTYMELYLLVADGYGLDNVQAVLNLYEAELARKATPQEIANAILIDADPVTKSISSMTMKIWLFGIWFGSSEAKYIKNPDYAKDFVISGHCYVNSYVWKMAQAHPAGYSNFAFGSWSDVPPTLSDYGL